MKPIYILIVSIYFVSCSPQKRLNRLIDRHPELSQQDTIRDTVTFIIPEVRVDTFLTLENLLDTVYITEDRLKIKTIYKDNKIFIQGKCETDTVEIIREIPVERVIYLQDTLWSEVKRKAKKYAWILIVITLFIVGKRLAQKFI